MEFQGTQNNKAMFLSMGHNDGTHVTGVIPSDAK